MDFSSVKKEEADRTAEAMAQMERYCRKHPRSPSAVRRPKIMLRGSSFIALLGSTLQDGIAGIGASVEAALHAFDSQYAALRTRRR